MGVSSMPRSMQLQFLPAKEGNATNRNYDTYCQGKWLRQCQGLLRKVCSYTARVMATVLCDIYTGGFGTFYVASYTIKFSYSKLIC